MKAVRALLAKELTDALRDGRTLFLTLGLPILLYPALTILMGLIVAAGRERLRTEPLRVAFTTSDARALVEARGALPYTTLVRTEEQEAQRLLSEGDVAAVLRVERGALEVARARGQARVEILYTKRRDPSMEARDRLQRVLTEMSRELLVNRLSSAGLPDTFAEPLHVEEVDIDFERNIGPLIASRLLPIMLLMMLVMGAIYPAIDVTAGEKERGTLETLLVAPVEPMQVMAAKYLTVVVITAATTLVNIGTMALTFMVGLHVSPSGESTLDLSGGQILTLLAAMVPASFMVAGFALALASLARSFKEAQGVLTPLVLGVSLPALITLMPGVELDAWTAAVPLLNLALLIKATVLGTAQLLHGAITVVVTVACALFSLWLAGNAFRSEALRFGGAESWRELFFPRRG